MAYCPNCGTSVSPEDKFCPVCGEKINKTSAKDKFHTLINTKDHASEFSPEDVENNKLIFALSYLGITFWLPLLVAKDSACGRFHANQGLLVLILSLVLSIISGIFANIIILSSLLSALASLIVLFYILFGVVNVLNGKAKELPLIGNVKLLK